MRNPAVKGSAFFSMEGHMPRYRCLSDASHDTFRIIAERVLRVAYFTNRDGQARDDETPLDMIEKVQEVICAECGSAVEVLE